ncbi:MAG: hypothetical protein WDN28_03525 [Chthoniobacter sp.]
MQARFVLPHLLGGRAQEMSAAIGSDDGIDLAGSERVQCVFGVREPEPGVDLFPRRPRRNGRAGGRAHVISL